MNDHKDHQIGTLADLIGHDISRPEPAVDPTAWIGVEHAPAPSVLGPVRMPNLHLSLQIAWFHKLMTASHKRQARSSMTKALRRARAEKRKAADTPERREMLKAKKASYMRSYRRNRKLDRLRMRGERLSPEQKRQVAEHRRRALLLKKARDKRRRAEIRRAYLDALIRDSKTGGVKDPVNHTFIVDRED